MFFNRPNPAERDRELLSAYVDGQLDSRERSRLEARLAAEPALRAELEELRRTVAAIRSLARVRAPRSFTLDPRVARQRQAGPFGRLVPALQLATAVSALLFVFLLADRAVTLQTSPFGSPAAPLSGSLPAAGGMTQQPGAPDVFTQQSPGVEGTPLPEATSAAERSALPAEPTAAAATAAPADSVTGTGPTTTITMTGDVVAMSATAPAATPQPLPTNTEQPAQPPAGLPGGLVDPGLWLTGAVGLLAVVFGLMTWVARRAQ